MAQASRPSHFPSQLGRLGGWLRRRGCSAGRREQATGLAGLRTGQAGLIRFRTPSSSFFPQDLDAVFQLYFRDFIIPRNIAKKSIYASRSFFIVNTSVETLLKILKLNIQALFINIIAARLQQIPALTQLDTLGCKDYKLDKILQVLLH